MSKFAVEILNPIQGGIKYTSLKNAQRFVANGFALFVGNKLAFIEHNQNKNPLQRTMCFWNGDTGSTKLHKPGEVRC